MILSTYDHGDESPATDLNARQLRAALADRGGALWVDLRAPTDADAAVLATSLRLPPSVVAWLCHAAPRPDAPTADLLNCATLVDAGGEIDVVLGPNVVVTRDRGSHSHAAHLAAPAAPPTLRTGADGFAAQLVLRVANNLESDVATLGGRFAQALSEAARKPGAAEAALHTVQRRAAALAEAVAVDQAAASALRAAGQVRESARTALDTALSELSKTATELQTIAERARSAAPSAELLALAAIARDVHALKIAATLAVALLAVLLVVCLNVAFGL